MRINGGARHIGRGGRLWPVFARTQVGRGCVIAQPACLGWLHVVPNNLARVAVRHAHAHGWHGIGVDGDQHLVTRAYARYVAQVKVLPGLVTPFEADALVATHRARLGHRCGQGAHHIHGRGNAQVLGLDQAPGLIARHAVAAVLVRAVIGMHGYLGHAVQAIPGDLLARYKAQPAFKVALPQVLCVLNLPGAARSARGMAP